MVAVQKSHCMSLPCFVHAAGTGRTQLAAHAKMIQIRRRAILNRARPCAVSWDRGAATHTPLKHRHSTCLIHLCGLHADV